MAHLTEEALEALAVSKGTDPHLASCPQCSRALVQASARRALLKGLHDVTLTDAAFKRVEHRLMEAVESGAAAPSFFRARWFGFAVAGAAFALGAVAVQSFKAPPEPKVAIVEPVKKPVLEAPRAAFATLTASEVNGAVSLGGKPLTAGDEVVAGAHLDASKGRAVLLNAAQEFELAGQADFGGTSTVALLEGRVAAFVSTRSSIHFDDSDAVAADADFSVVKSAGAVTVEVLRGTVEVAGRTVRAGERLLLPGGTVETFDAGSSFRPASKGIFAAPFARLDVSDLGLGTLDVDGHRLGGTPGSLLLTPGPHHLKLTDSNGTVKESTLQFVSGTPVAFHAPKTVVEPEREPTADDMAALMRDIRDQSPRLQVCVEKWLKANPQAGGTAELTLSVSARGTVTHVSVSEATVPQESVNCLKRAAKQLRLPALGSAQDVVLPLVLKAKR